MKIAVRLLPGLVLPILLFLVVAGCQMEDSSATGALASGLTGGGTGGTGTGTITGYHFQGPNENEQEISNAGVDSNLAEGASGPVLVLNGNRHLTVTDATFVMMDAMVVSIWDLIAKGTGLVASVIIDKGHNPAVTQAAAVKVSVNHWIIGPVTETVPELSVLGQTVAVDNQTVMKGVSKASDLQAGDVVEVSGFADASNRILASRVELRSDPVSFWKLTGPAGDFVPGISIAIGSQTVSLAGVSPANCGTGLAVGDLLEVRAEPNQEFLPAATLRNVFKVTCMSFELEAPDHSGEEMAPAEIEGIVFSVELPTFMLGSQQVFITPQTKFTGGDPNNLVEGAHLLVEGLLDPNSGILIAGRIRFF